MAVQQGKDVVGIARQSAKGATAPSPQFSHGVESGGIAVEANQEPDPLTSSYDSHAGAFRDKVATSAQYTARAWEKSVGLYLLGVLGDLQTSTPANTHTIKQGTPPYLTVFEKKGDGTILAVPDCKVDELSFEWEENAPVKLGATLVGASLAFPASFVADVDEVDTTDYFTPVGGTFKLDVDSGTPVVTPITGGSITLKRSAEAKFFSGAILAGDVQEGRLEGECSFKLVPNNLDDWRTIITGSASGTTVKGEPVYGSFEVTFVHGTHSLKLTAPRVAYLCDLPEADAGGGAAELELSGILYRSGDTPLTAVLFNTQASYEAETPGS